jgi:uncharacterized membrane protein
MEAATLAEIRVLFAGESWVTHSVHVKGFDSFETSSYQEGGTALIEALRSGGASVTYQPSHVAANAFPGDREGMAAFDVVILSDIGANTLLLPDQTFVRSGRTANRLSLLADFVTEGGGLLMIGGYLTFQGIQAKANYQGTRIDEILPVRLQASDDRSERPDGVAPEVVDGAHPVMAGLDRWPHLLGYNRAALRPEGRLLASVDGDPLVAVREVGRGRTAVFSSDCGPHWGPPEFVAWDGYPRLWRNLVAWLAGR